MSAMDRIAGTISIYQKSIQNKILLRALFFFQQIAATIAKINMILLIMNRGKAFRTALRRIR